MARAQSTPRFAGRALAGPTRSTRRSGPCAGTSAEPRPHPRPVALCCTTRALLFSRPGPLPGSTKIARDLMAPCSLLGTIALPGHGLGGSHRSLSPAVPVLPALARRHSSISREHEAPRGPIRRSPPGADASREWHRNGGWIGVGRAPRRCPGNAIAPRRERGGITSRVIFVEPGSGPWRENSKARGVQHRATGRGWGRGSAEVQRRALSSPSIGWVRRARDLRTAWCSGPEPRGGGSSPPPNAPRPHAKKRSARRSSPAP